MSTTVLIIDSSEIVRAGLSEYLGAADGIDVIGETGDCSQARQWCTEYSPDVVILDLGKPDSDRVELIRFFREELPSTRLLVFTSNDCFASATHFMQAGVDGYLVKEASSDEIVAAVRAAAAGRKMVSISEFCQGPHVPPGQTTRSNSTSKPDEKLSEREREVLTLIARGKTNQQIADEIFLSVKTIETYRSRLAKKIGATSRADLYAYASATGMLAEA